MVPCISFSKDLGTPAWASSAPSNTGPILVMRFEAGTGELERARAEVEGIVAEERKKLAGRGPCHARTPGTLLTRCG